MECTGVIRLDFETLAPLGYEVICADEATVDEATARQVAADTFSYQGPAPDQSDLISNPAHAVDGGEELYIFFAAPSDFGKVEVVDALNGQPIFAASVVWMGRGGIVYPHEWLEPLGFDPDCGGVVDLSAGGVTWHDLTGGGADSATTRTLDDVLTAAASTPLPQALRDGTAAYVKNTVVLLYPPSVGSFDPSVAEYVVLINAGWE